MKRNKGFTLIELLAVIVILAVIALIATPIIMNVINDSKKGAAKDAMYGYVKAIELASAKAITPTTDAPDDKYTTENGNLKKGSETITINFKGTKPKDGGEVTLSKGNVIHATLEFDGIPVEYDGKEVETGNISSKKYDIGDEVYFDPTGSVTDCTSGKEWTINNTKTTCYKWNVVKDNGSSIELLLNHNISQMGVWLSKEDFITAGGTEEEYSSMGQNKYGPITAIKQLKNSSSAWTKVETLTSSDNVTRNSSNGGTYTIDYHGMKARLISGQEVADIAGDSTWNPSKYSGIVYSNHSWLYQNTDFIVNNNAGYWTDTAIPSVADSAWGISSDGYILNTYVGDESRFGIRPVVRVLKSNM